MSDRIVVSLALQRDYQMLLEFDEPEDGTVLVDEAPPLGSGAGPAPSRLLASAVVSCLSASLLFCLRKSRIEVEELHARRSRSRAQRERPPAHRAHQRDRNQR
jgi:uncharacterized OsmC-like protein